VKIPINTNTQGTTANLKKNIQWEFRKTGTHLTLVILYSIWAMHVAGYELFCLRGWNAMFSYESHRTALQPAALTDLLFYPEDGCMYSFETPIDCHLTTQRCSPENITLLWQYRFEFCRGMSAVNVCEPPGVTYRLINPPHNHRCENLKSFTVCSLPVDSGVLTHCWSWDGPSSSKGDSQ
jgi:hypothetical protein